MPVGVQSFAPNWRKVKVDQGTNPRREARDDTFQIGRCASQPKPMQECHPERSEGSLAGQRSFAALRMTQRDGLVFEMYCPQGVPLDVGTGNSVIVPLVVMRPILPFWLVRSLWLSVDSVNQRFPSGPVVM